MPCAVHGLPEHLGAAVVAALEFFGRMGRLVSVQRADTAEGLATDLAAPGTAAEDVMAAAREPAGARVVAEGRKCLGVLHVMPPSPCRPAGAGEGSPAHTTQNKLGGLHRHPRRGEHDGEWLQMRPDLVARPLQPEKL